MTVNDTNVVVKTDQSQKQASIGDFVDEELIKFTYVLSPKGTLIEKKTALALIDSHGDPASLVAKLLKLKPSGGRLRVTKSGKILAYFDNAWGFLYQIENDEWFQGHFN